MKKYKIVIHKKVEYFDHIEVNASCPVEAKRIARMVAKEQERAEALGQVGIVHFEGKKYLAYSWNEIERPSYSTEIIK